MTQRAVLCFTAALGLLVGLGSRAAGAPVTWEFEGTVRYVNLGDASVLAGSLGVSVGASASGQMTYENSGPFPRNVLAFEVAIGSYATGPIGPTALDALYVRVPWNLGPWELEFADGLGPADLLYPTGPIMELSLIADTQG